ncbi:MAG: hypothetical protein V4706_01690 [Pseudomonadota bacterium]
MSPQLLIAVGIAAASFTTGWTVQSWRYDAKENERAQQTLADQRLAAAVSIRRTDNVIDAQNAAAGREVVLRRDAAGARTALIGLHDASEAAMRDAATTHAACLVRAATFSELLDTVASAGGELAEKAGRHANDAKTLSEAWPK